MSIKRLRKQRNNDFSIIYIVLVLSIIGIAMSVSASMGGNNVEVKTLLLAMAKQFINVLLGVISMVLVIRIFKFQYLNKRTILVLKVGTLLLLLLTRFFPEINGAYAWIPIPNPFYQYSIQPAEFAKLVILLIVAYHAKQMNEDKESIKRNVKEVFTWIMIYVVVVSFVQKDVGTALIMLVIGCVLYFVPSQKKLVRQQVLAFMGLFVLMLFALFLMSENGLHIIERFDFLKFRIQRFQVVLDPFTNRYGEGYQLVNSLIAFAKGGLFGLGFGNSTLKYGRLPAASTDFVLAIIAEEFGLLGITIVFALYIILLYKLVMYALKASNIQDKIILIGFATYLFAHFLLNVGGVSGLIPLTGVPLLLVSSGGSSTIATLMGVGFCYSAINRINREQNNENNSR